MDNNCSVKMVFCLKQQTPMIHFQYDEAGACIRASEFKPKLDKYLHENCSESIKKEWLITDKDSKDHNEKRYALKYKVRIISNGTPDISISDSDPKKKSINAMYFGNGGDGEKKETVFYRDGIRVEIVCLIRELRDLINTEMDSFLAETNFGTRQSKGFGCFSRISGEQTLRLLESKSDVFFYTKVPGFVYGNEHSSAIAKADANMNIAAAIYATMKGGINFTRKNPDAYIKGYIQREYLERIGKKNVGSDKAFIKKRVLPGRNIPQDRKGEEEYEQYEFVRALLGLAGQYEYRDDCRKGKVMVSSPEIARFKSPVTIKIVDDFIFFIFNNSYKELLGKQFSFMANGKEEHIKVPTEFNAKEFVKGFIQYFEQKKFKFEIIGYPHKNAIKCKLILGGAK